MVRFTAFLIGATAIAIVPATAQAQQAVPATSAATPAPIAAATVAPTAPSPAIDDAAPAPPLKVAASFTTPSRDAAGRYATPARDVPAAQAAWFLRVALNVAALGCRDADEAHTVAAYNGFLAAHAGTLATSRSAVLAAATAAFGAATAQAHDDDAMTRTYNFFAQPVAHDAFCAAAKQVLGEIATIEPGAVDAYAAAALGRLDAPFTQAFASHDAWRAQYAAWQARHAPPVTVATAAPVPVAAPVLVAAAAPVVVAVPAAPSAPPVLIAIAPPPPAPVQLAAVH